MLAVGPSRGGPGERRVVTPRTAEQRSVELSALVEPVDVRLPCEANAAMRLDRAARDLSASGGGRRRGERRALAETAGIGVSRPSGEVSSRAGALGVQQHLCAAMADSLKRTHGHPELLAVLHVLQRHLERALTDPHHLGGDSGENTSRSPGFEGLAIA